MPRHDKQNLKTDFEMSFFLWKYSKMNIIRLFFYSKLADNHSIFSHYCCCCCCSFCILLARYYFINVSNFRARAPQINDHRVFWLSKYSYWAVVIIKMIFPYGHPHDYYFKLDICLKDSHLTSAYYIMSVRISYEGKNSIKWNENPMMRGEYM